MYASNEDFLLVENITKGMFILVLNMISKIMYALRICRGVMPVSGDHRLEFRMSEPYDFKFECRRRSSSRFMKTEK